MECSAAVVKLDMLGLSTAVGLLCTDMSACDLFCYELIWTAELLICPDMLWVNMICLVFFPLDVFCLGCCYAAVVDGCRCCCLAGKEWRVCFSWMCSVWVDLS